MALRPDYEAEAWYLDFYMDSVAEKGTLVSISTVGSGSALDHTLNVAAKPTTSSPANTAFTSGVKPLGVLTHDVVNIDLTKQHLNQHKAEVQVGMKVAIIKRGWVVTNMVRPGTTPAAGDDAFLGVSGYFNPGGAGIVDGFNGMVKVGRFISTLSEGYCKIEVNIP